MSFLAIAVSEMGDKTQLITLCLAAQYRRTGPVLLGILAATIASNLLATGVGEWMGELLKGKLLHLLLALSFIAAAVWSLIPEKLESCPPPKAGHSIFIASFLAFLIAEMGDKTQLVTAALAARYHAAAAVIVGTTLGMMAANIPAALAGGKLVEKFPLKTLRIASGVLFAGLGAYELFGLI